MKQQQSISLSVPLIKAIGTDKHGNYLFEVEASNENLDLDEQRVLQQALMNAQEHFLKNGVISKDHLHSSVDDNGKITRDERFVIGEPLKVFTQGNRTFIRGVLYKSNKFAQEFIRLLKDGSTRIKASVGGLFPKIKGNTIVDFLWNDVALTIAPVNATVGSAMLVKSINSSQFVRFLAKEKKMGKVSDAISNLKKVLNASKNVRKSLEDDDSDDSEELEDDEVVEKSQDDEAYDNITERFDQSDEKIESLKKAFHTMAQVQEAMGEAMTVMLERFDQMAQQPQPRKGVTTALGKSVQNYKHQQFTQESKMEAMKLMQKAIECGKATIKDVVFLEDQINRSVRDPQYQIDGKYSYLLNEMMEKE